MEERLARAKRAAPPQQPRPPAKRQATAQDEDSELDLADLSAEVSPLVSFPLSLYSGF